MEDTTAQKEEVKKNYEIEEAGPCKKKFQFEIPLETIKEEYEANLKELLSHAQVKGFRKGKVPRKMMERKYQDELIKEVRTTVIQNAFEGAIEEEALKPIDEPKLDGGEPVLELGKPLSFALTVEVEPDFELKEYKDIEVEIETEPITDKTVEDTIEHVRKHQGTLKEKEEQKVAEGDHLELSFTGHYDDVEILNEESSPYQWGDKKIMGIAVEGFEEAALDKEPGEEFSIAVNFQKYQLSDEQRVALKDEEIFPGELRVKLLKISEMSYPELNDEFAKEQASVETMDDYRKKVREDLEEQKTISLKKEAGQKVLEKLREELDFDVPEGVVEKHLLQQFQSSPELNQMMSENPEMLQGNRDEVQAKIKEIFEVYKTDHLEDAKKEFRERLILERVAKKERIYVTEQEVEYRVQFIAQIQNMDPELVLERFREGGQLEAIRSDMKAEKTLDALGNNAKVKEIPKKAAEKDSKDED